MKKIKIFMMALLAICATSVFTACSSDDNDSNESNTDRYQEAVDQTVKSQKKNDKVILLVAFGSTWQQAFDAFDKTVESYKAQFPGYDVFLSFSSAICINRSAAGEHVASRNFYSPNYWLESFGRVQYSTIVVQSLQVIPGEEYTRVINYIKDFANNNNGDLDDSYLSKVKLYLGTPLMANADTDVDALANALNTNFSSYSQKGTVTFMGHGNPNTYDTYKANIRYSQLETALQKLNPNYYVGTVDMPGNYKVNVLDRMKANGITSGTVYCHPLMSIAGDHAHNDMAGNDCAATPFKKNGEGEVEDTSWKMYFQKNGYTCDDNTQIVKGLLEYDNIRGLWINHTKNAIAGDPLDYYHSKNPGK
jgi:sirohydrochlorin cobaltochelatase